MTDSTTIRVSTTQRERLRKLAQDADMSMTATFDAALEALHRARFYQQMAHAEHRLQADPAAWADYTAERDTWLDAPLDSFADT